LAHAAVVSPNVRGRLRPSGVLTREVLVPGAFVAAILLSNYALSGLPNVKLFDLLVFAAGYALGFRRGGLVAVSAWLVYGSFNPWGPTHALLLLSQMAGQLGYAGAGVLVRRLVPPSKVTLRPSMATPVFVLAAIAATLVFDLITNMYTGYYWAAMTGGVEYGRWIWTALMSPAALFFVAVHVSSNALLFPVFGPLLIKNVERAKERFGWA
jgi:hypothetical protein